MVSLRRESPGGARGQWCNLCGARLAGSYSRLQAARFGRQPQHERASDRAAWSICTQCYQAQLRCATCDIPVGSQAFVLDGQPDFYCADCFKERPRCDTCDRPVGHRYWARPDGRTLCERCQSTAVTDPRVAQALYSRVRAALARQLGLYLREPCPLEIVSRRELQEMIDRSSLRNLDADSRGRCFGLFMQEGARRAIFIEQGLPQIVLLEVMAHEYAHAWQSENTPGNAPLEIQEGFAEWVAYKLLDAWGCRRRSGRMLMRDDLYGRGLKTVLAWEQRGGASEVFRSLSQS